MDAAIQTAPTSIKVPKVGVDLTHSDFSWFSKRVERGRKEIFVEIVTITPEIANRLLENNPDNRPINERIAAAIARDIANGAWKLNGETIIVSRDGQLNDGQTRLTAIARTGIPVQSAMMFGVSRESRMTVDMGKARDAAQFIGMSGTPQGNRVAAIARLNLILRSGSIKVRNLGLTKQDTLREFNENKDAILLSVKTSQTKFASSLGASSLGGSSFLPVAWLAIRAVDSIGCDLFFDALQTGVHLDRDDPILWLRAKLIETINKKQRLRAEEKLEFVLRYWNAWAQGHKIKTPLKMTGNYPEIRASKRNVRGESS